MSINYKLLEDVETQNNKGSFNIYVTDSKIYCISTDNFTSALRKINRISGSIGGVGALFGIVGLLLITIPAGALAHPFYKKEKLIALAKMRNISMNELEKIKGFCCAINELNYEKSKDNYKVYFGDDWILLLESDAANLHNLMSESN